MRYVHREPLAGDQLTGAQRLAINDCAPLGPHPNRGFMPLTAIHVHCAQGHPVARHAHDVNLSLGVQGTVTRIDTATDLPDIRVASVHRRRPLQRFAGRQAGFDIVLGL